MLIIKDKSIDGGKGFDWGKVSDNSFDVIGAFSILIMKNIL